MKKFIFYILRMVIIMSIALSFSLGIAYTFPNMNDNLYFFIILVIFSIAQSFNFSYLKEGE